MGKHPKLENLNKHFRKGKDFELTDREYERLTGVRLPKDNNYIINRSALAKKCQQEGYTLSVQEKIVFIKRVR